MFRRHGHTTDETMYTELSRVARLAVDFSLVFGESRGVQLAVACPTTEATGMEGLEIEEGQRVNRCLLRLT